ncbi:MAG: hypothetical protein H6Q89_2755 [Myxococcaceae bacterium]|nr:hypothetical protein [Myxococcaceae bacterium]
MKLRFSLVLASIALFSTGCASKYFIQKDAYTAVKKVALVQHAINPHFLLGTANADEAKTKTVEKNFEVITKEMAGSYAVTPLAEMVANPAYTGAGGKAAWDGFYTAKGAAFFSADEDTLRAATIPADTAKKLCEGLGVDAVAVIYEDWAIESYALGFRAKSRNGYIMNMFDKNGVKVWGDVVWGTSEEGMGLVGGVISTDVDTYVLNNGQSFAAALKEANEHIAGK